MVKMAWFKPLGSSVARGGGACGSPFSRVNVHVAHQVAGNRSTSVIKWWIPAKLDVLGANLIGVQIAGFERHV